MVLYQKILTSLYEIILEHQKMDIKQIKELMDDFDNSGLSGFKIKKDDIELEFSKTITTTAITQPQTLPAASLTTLPIQNNQPSQDVSADAILSPMVGTFYTAPSPDSPAFVKKGDTIKKGQVIGILEAMKIMNELEAEFDCKILDVLVSDGQPVEYDMPLFAIQKI